MNMLDFFANEGKSRRTLIFLIVTSGASSGLLLNVINSAAEVAADSDFLLRYFVLFAVTLLFFTVTKRTALILATRVGEKVIRETRIRISDKIRHSELLFLEHVGRGDIYARLTQDSASISQAVPMVFNGYQSAVTLLAGLVYIGMISWVAFFLTLAFLLFGGYAYVSHSRKIIAELKCATAKEAEFFDSLSHLVDGFKEIRINHNKNHDVHAQVAKVARETESLMVSTGMRYITHLVMSQTTLFLLIGAIVFVLPTLDIANPEHILKLTAAGLFIVSPLEVVFTAYYFQNKATVALQNIDRLEKRLDATLGSEYREQHQPLKEPSAGLSNKEPSAGLNNKEPSAGLNNKEPSAGSRNKEPRRTFESIKLRGLYFKYPGEGSTYSIGPLDITFKRGTATFIVGGNGCGKSTLLKVLTGLYPPTSGRILIDDKVLTERDYPRYRELFSAIFGDFHLFDKLYGLTDIDEREVDELLEEMEIADKTGFVNNAFTNLDLSTGQRKRLAMVIARLEQKPFYVFDEWAADQDPQFRRNFYEVLIPRLKAEGKTLVVVTHDDAYFHHADQLIKLDYGKLALSA